MNASEADDITVTADERHEGRSVVSVIHGNFTTSLRVSDGELKRIRDAIDAHLRAPQPGHEPAPTSPTGRIDSPVTCSVCGAALVLSRRERPDGSLEWDQMSDLPADDVREALIGGIARDEQDWRFGDFEETSNHSPSLAEYIADGILANPLFEVRPCGTVTDAEALAKAWDEGVRTAGAYGHEYTWTHDMTPYSQNPYRKEARA